MSVPQQRESKSNSTSSSHGNSNERRIRVPVDISDNHEIFKITLELVKWGISLGLTYYLSQKLFGILKEMSGVSVHNEIDSARRNLAKRLKRPELEHMELNGYEARISFEIQTQDDLDVGFDNIGGLEKELMDVKDNVSYAVLRIKLTVSSLK